MADKKFNPIQELPILPGQETVPQTIPEPIVMPEEKVSTREKVVQSITIISIGLILLAFIFLAIIIVPKVVDGVSSAGKYVSSLFKPTTKSVETTPVSSVNIATSTSAAINSNTTYIGTPTPLASNSPKTAPITLSPANLGIKIISVTRIGDQASVRFNVQNVGQRPSGTWTFSANLPSSITPVYYSAVQQSISPLSGIVYTLSFTATPYMYIGTNSQIRIRIFPNAGEINPYNNVAVGTLN